MPGKKVITYMGTHQQTRKWVRLESYGPKLVENLTQAVARDCLRDSMMALDAEGYDIRFTVHDEIIATEPMDGRSAEDMAEVMGRTLPWAEGLPLKAEAYACSSYRKD
jgi:DNA polymerase